MLTRRTSPFTVGPRSPSPFSNISHLDEKLQETFKCSFLAWMSTWVSKWRQKRRRWPNNFPHLVGSKTSTPRGKISRLGSIPHFDSKTFVSQHFHEWPGQSQGRQWLGTPKSIITPLKRNGVISFHLHFALANQPRHCHISSQQAGSRLPSSIWDIPCPTCGAMFVIGSLCAKHRFLRLCETHVQHFSRAVFT